MTSPYTKAQLYLSIPGALFALIGAMGLLSDTAVALLIIAWGIMAMPVFWVALEVRFLKNFTWVHKSIAFFLVFVIAGLFMPPTEVKEEQLSSDRLSQIVEETIATTPSVSPDMFSDETGELLVPSEAEVSESGEARVVDVIDGDTLKVHLNGKVETIRVIGIDTPETVHPSEPVGCFGYEASNKAKELLTGTTVKVVTDASQGERDKYDRYLAYITLENGTDFGEAMLRGGYAYEYTYGNAYANQSTYKAAETYASSNEVGLWAPEACGEVLDTQPQDTYVAPVPVSSSGCSIKGNISYSTGEKIYHVPGQQNYDDTVIDTSKGESWFCTESEAVAAGWRKAKR